MIPGGEEDEGRICGKPGGLPARDGVRSHITTFGEDTVEPLRPLLSRAERQASSAQLIRQVSRKKITRGLSQRQMSIASIVLGSTLGEDGDDQEDLPFVLNPNLPKDLPYSKVPIPDNLLKIIVVILYFMQFVGSLVFLRWLSTAGWNYKSPATSTIFFLAELIALVSTNMFLFSGLLRVLPKRDKPKNNNEDLTDKNDSTYGIDEYEEVTDFMDYTHEDNTKNKDEEIPTVAVCVCRYKEPLEDLIMTVHSMDRINWPADKLQLFILDDGWHARDRMYQRDQALNLADICGADQPSRRGPPRLEKTEEIYRPDCATECNYWEIREPSAFDCSVTLVARKKPEDSHYKAGNLNNFLYNYLGHAAQRGLPIPEYMVMLDHDMLPHPEFVSDAVVRLKQDRFRAFIQYPQRFYDINGSDLFYAGNELFFDGVEINRSQVGLTAFAGTNAMWNLQSLYHVGGFQYGSLTEDAHTGMAVNIAGYTSIYSLRELAVGQSPQTVEDAMRQRMRWSQGSVEMMVHHVKSMLTGKSPFTKIELPEELGSFFQTTPPSPPGCMERFIMLVLFFDSMVYPFYSMGFLLHTLVCLMYLFNAEAPIAPADPTQVLYFWLPLYIVKAACQVLVFPGVSLATQWSSQMAWAGYSLSTLASIRSGLCSGGGWFNTGAAKKDRFMLQYGNTVVGVAIYIMIVYRAIAFIAIDKTCTAWMTTGALLYGLVMLAHVREWAIEPFRRVQKEDEASVVMLRESMHRSSSRDESSASFKIHEKAIRQSRNNREQHQSLDLSLLFIFLHVVLVSFLLFFWASGNCDFAKQISTPGYKASTLTKNEYCNFNDCLGGEQGGEFCNLGKEECFSCGGDVCVREMVLGKNATTTRYWDCAGGSCGCGFIGKFSEDPVHCYSNAPFAAPEKNPYGAKFYGAAAVSQALGGGEWQSESCGRCWKLTAWSNIDLANPFKSTIVLKGTNYCPPENVACNGKAHFDIAVPGFDFLANSFKNDCNITMPDELEGLSACEFWMERSQDPEENCDCSLLKNPTLRAGCENFLTLKWVNPVVEYDEVVCPPELAQLPCWEDNGRGWPMEAPDTCLNPFAK